MPLSFFILKPPRWPQALLLLVVIWGTLFETAAAVKFITAATAPAGLSTGCLNALTADVACSLYVSRFRPGYFYTEKVLTEACTAGCESGLLAYESSVVSACLGDTWQGYDDDDERGEQLGTIPSLLRYLYSVICLRDNNRWCNVLAGQAAQAADPGNSPGLFQGEIGANITAPNPCDMCFVKSLRIQASVPYFDGPALANALVYENKTSSCSIQNMPRTTSTLGITLKDGMPAPTPAPCTGATYQIQPGDDCHKISNSQKIGTGWLLSDNKLGAWCEDFPTSGSLCLANKCNVVTVPANATCKAIAKSANTTEVLLKAWNPVLNAGCYNIENLEGHQLCVSPPGPVYVDPNPGVLAPTTASEPAPVPTDLANGTTTRCGKYYQVQPDEYCNLLVVRFHISLSDFLFLNPALNANCTNLFAFESYCIEPVGDIATYPGQPGNNPTNPVSSIPFTPLVPILPTITNVFPVPIQTDVPAGGELPIAPGTRRDCVQYFNGSSFQNASDIAGMIWLNQCQRAADIFSAKYDDIAFWNSDLADIRTPACAFDPQYRYCRQLIPSVAQPAPELPPDHELPIREGTISTCTEFADIGEDWECTDVLENFQLTIAQFFEYNPAVKSDCSGLWPSMAYCIRAPGYPDPDDNTSTATISATRTASTTSVTGPTGPTHTGQPANCNKWHTVADGDTCATVPTKYGITQAQFLAWNPAVSADCTVNFWLGQSYCVGTSSPVSSSSATSTTSAGTSSSSAAGPPGPTHTGQPANCNKWHVVASGDTCANVPPKYGISQAQFLAWNPAVSADCTVNFWLNQAYCVGVSGSTPTPTSTTGASSATTKSAGGGVAAPTPNQAGNAVANCNRYAQAQSGDWCALFATRNSVALGDLYKWNTVLKADGSGCDTFFWGTYWYCVDVA
ncbi:hypothetical protein QBC35DRAFT_452972 [Podospora australis]|uniref:LysM domain-containing protein n=1 Tax=Podospora australis TaxID=1536484 RepID=A0AAN6WUY5_9PEZI|nr:hypothetical protein QBC35DRAFT_452972 [Podospora australis]